MANAIEIPSVFKAIDRFTRPLKRMQQASRGFADRTEAAFNRVRRSETKLRNGIGKLLGRMGQLGLGFGALATMGMVARSNIDLEKNLASLSAITGVTGEAFKDFEKQIDIVSKRQKVFAGETAKAFEIVGSAKPELLGNADALSKVTEATMILSKATGDELEVSARNLTGTLNQFNLGAEHSERVINALAAGSQAGAAAVPLITESLDKFGTVAASMNVSVEESIGMIETLAEKNLVGAEAGTKLRNVLTNMSAIKALPPKAIKELERFGVNMDVVSDASLPVNERLKELSKISGDATAMFRVFGKENLVAGQILLQNVDKVDSYTKAVTGSNVANEQAATNTNTISKRLEELKDSFATATTTTNSNSLSLRIFKGVLVLLADNMQTIIGLTVTLIGLFIAYKVAMLATRMAIIGMNVAMGTQAAISGKLTKSVATNKIALIAYATAQKVAAISTKLVTVATAIFGATLWATPIGWIIAGIVALVGVIVLLARNWDKITAVFQNFIDKWKNIGEIFKTDGFVEGIKAVGKTILEFMLKPLELILSLVARIPGKLGQAAGVGLEKLQDFTSIEDEQGGTQTDKVSLSAEQTQAQKSITEKTMREQVEINLNNRTDKDVSVGPSPVSVPIISNTYSE